MFALFQKHKSSIWITLGFIAFLVFRLALLAANSFPFNSDEAIIGLMARHILSGERPIFFYGQAYMGSLDAYLVAIVFKLVGASVLGIRIVQVTLYAFVIVTSVILLRNAFSVGYEGWMIVWLLALPNVNLVLYTTVSLGGYGEMLLIGNLIWIILSKLLLINKTNGNPKDAAPVMLFGFLIGLGLWTHGLTLVYSIPAGLFWLISCIKNKVQIKRILVYLGLLTVGVLVGSLPWWLYAYQNGIDQLINELFGSAVAVDQSPFVQMIIDRLIRLVVLGGTVILGMRPPWTVRWLALPLMPFILALALATLGYWIREILKRRAVPMLVWIIGSSLLLLTAGFIFTSFGNDPSGRYFLPITVFGCFLLVGIIARASIRPVLGKLTVALIIVFNMTGVLQCALVNPPGITTQFDQTTVVDHQYQEGLVNFLRNKGEIRGYTNYWISYPLAFQSNEQVIFVPVLPYHQDLRYSPRDNRYALYNDVVSASERVAYITSNTPLLDEYLRSQFNQVGISWQETNIGDYCVFYDLSKAVRPVDIGLGVLR